MSCSGKTACLPPPPFTVADTDKSMAVLWLLLLSLGALFFSSNAQDTYSKLPETYRKGVNLALEKVNSHAGIQHHFRFYGSVTKSDIEVLYLYYMYMVWFSDIV